MTEEVANLVTYVCSPLSAATNGAKVLDRVRRELSCGRVR